MLNHIYFGARPSVDQTISKDVQSYGLNLLKLAPCNVKTSVYLQRAQLGFDSYRAHLPAFVRAQQDKKIISNLAGFYPLKKTDDELIPLPYPPIWFHYSKETELSEHGLKLLHDRGAKMVKFGKRDLYEISDYTPDIISEIKRTNCSIDSATANGRINIRTYQYTLMVQRILTAILRVHSYPAFRDEDEYGEAFELPRIGEVVKEVAKGKKRKATTPAEGDVTGATSADEAEVDLNAIDPAIVNLTKAKPNIVNEYPWGSPNDLRVLPGLYFSFAQCLALPDTLTIPAVIEKYFLHGLAPNEEQTEEVLDSIRSATGFIAMTNLGKVLSHQFKCLDLALQSQCLLYPVYSRGVYSGSAIQGYHFTVAIHREIYHPISSELLQQAVVENNPVMKALTRINVLTGKDVDSVLTMRELRSKIKDSRLAPAEVEEIKSLMSQVNFNEVYYKANPVSIEWMIRCIRKPSEEIDNLVPLHPSCLFTQSRIEEVISAFGLYTPTFDLEGREYMEIRKMKTPPAILAYGYDPIPKAAESWRVLMEEGVLHNNPKGLSKEYQFTVVAASSKEKIWKKLRMLAPKPKEKAQKKESKLAESRAEYAFEL